MVWIHGGAFVAGSGSSRWYDGARFAASGEVVVVTFNYRLGAVGFLDLAAVGGERFASSGNCGLLDQLAALRWVQDNISAFGGDPDRVTVFGESAGAMSIGLMLAMPAAGGLFQRAILQSGARSAYRTSEEAEQVTAELLAAFGGSVDDLVAAPIDRIIEAQTAVTQGSFTTAYLAFRPVANGIDIPEHPDPVAAGDGARGGFPGPVLIGTNRDEMTLFLAFEPGIAALTDDGLDRRAEEMVGAERWARLKGHYQTALPTGDPASRLYAAATDLVFRVPALRLAESQAGAGPVWMYRFDWPTPAFGGQLGATHALDIPFVWDLLHLPGVEFFTGLGPGREQLAEAMHRAWLAFATSGDPSTPLLPDWPAYQAPRRATMIFDAECRLADDPNGAERQLWDAEA
jgi:para-nitrobenzyl esterase